MTIRRLYTGSLVYGSLPPGCRLCLRGLKSVIFVTGLCPRRCFYCPLSRERRGRDVVYVNERPVKNMAELLAEVLVSGSRGAGLTGGDPLVRPARTLKFLRTLKEELGSSFHVHLYTSGRTLTPKLLLELEKAGLDELRLHPEPSDVDRLLELLKCVKPSIEVGFEIPMLPDGLGEALNLVKKLAACDAVTFLNVNELEFSEENSGELLARGYRLSDDWKSAVGSKEAALKLLEVAEEEGLPLSIHFCPAGVKDRFQTGLRLYRRGVLSARLHELVSDEGTLLKALVSEDCENAPSHMVFRGRIGPETSVALAELLGLEYRLIEELPNHQRTLLNVG
ncbi:MAG: radical SAM protein [Thermoprotei archaeon]|nr:MAG: radical SAM protein [Thermoprotei archaeon]RLE97058.1 MAG: radical SAM protein [Thermoprotei archaeon]